MLLNYKACPNNHYLDKLQYLRFPFNEIVVLKRQSNHHLPPYTTIS